MITCVLMCVLDHRLECYNTPEMVKDELFLLLLLVSIQPSIERYSFQVYCV